MKYHENLKRVAIRAINAVFADRSVSPQQTLDTLEQLCEELEIMTEALRQQIEQNPSRGITA